MYEIISNKNVSEIVSALRSKGYQLDMIPSDISGGVRSSFSAVLHGSGGGMLGGRNEPGVKVVIYDSGDSRRVELEALSTSPMGQKFNLKKGEQLCDQLYSELNEGSAVSEPQPVETESEPISSPSPAPAPKPPKPPKQVNKTVIIIAAVTVLVLAVGIPVLSRLSSTPSYDDEYYDDSYDGSYDDESYDDSEMSDDGYDEEYPNNGNDSYFQIGNTYQIQTNLRVREGPGKEYRILNRDELVGDDYANSVDSKTTTDALMEKGKYVTCLGMEGDWMRIESGWICVYDEGEDLVR